MSWGARSAPLREPKKTNALGAAKSNEENERRKDSHRGQMRRRKERQGDGEGKRYKRTDEEKKRVTRGQMRRMKERQGDR